MGVGGCACLSASPRIPAALEDWLMTPVDWMAGQASVGREEAVRVVDAEGRAQC